MLPSSLSAMIWQSSGCFSASLRITDLYRPCENDKVALVSLVINSITFSLQPSIKISFLFCSIIFTVLFFGVRSNAFYSFRGSEISECLCARNRVTKLFYVRIIVSTNSHTPVIFCLKIHQFVIIFNIIRQYHISKVAVQTH